MLFTPTKVKLFSQPVEGIVEETIAPNELGRVKCQATYWPARFYQPDCKDTVSPGALIVIIGIQGLTLLVIPS